MWELLTGEEPYANMHYGAIIGNVFYVKVGLILVITKKHMSNPITSKA
jgi:hypothetical protein